MRIFQWDEGKSRFETVHRAVYNLHREVASSLEEHEGGAKFTFPQFRSRLLLPELGRELEGSGLVCREAGAIGAPGCGQY